MFSKLFTISKNGFSLKNAICVLVLACSIIYMFYHLIHFIGYGDDIYPISLCHSIINGNIPFVNSWISYPGYVLISPIVLLYKMVNNGYTGVVFYYKCIYFVVVLCNIYIMYHIFGLKYKNNRLLNFISAVLINQSIYLAWSSLSYNYIFVLINVYAILIFCFYDCFKMNRVRISILSAVLMFIMSMFYPTSSIIAIVYSFVFLLKNNDIKYTVVYVLTGFLLFVVYILSIFVFGGSISSIIKTINEILALPHNKWKMGIIDSIILNTHMYYKYIILTFMIVLFMILLAYIISRINKRKVSLLPNYCLLAFVILFIVCYISSIQQNYILTILMAQPLLCLFFIMQIYENIPQIRRIIYFLLIVFPFYTMIISPRLFNAVEPFKQTKRIDCGIYNMLYTDNENYNFITCLEKDLNLFFANDKPSLYEVTVFPAVYIMTDAKVCAPDTWDTMQLDVANIESWKYTRNIKFPISSYPVVDYFNYYNVKPLYITMVDYYVRDFLTSNRKYEIKEYINKNYNIVYEKNHGLSNLVIYKLK